MQVRPSCPEDNTAVGIEKFIAGQKRSGDKYEGTEDEVCRDLCDEAMDIRVSIKGIQGKSLKCTKKCILDHIEATDEQKGQEEETAERIDDELQKRELEDIKPYIFEKNGVFLSEGYGVEEKKRLVPMRGSYRAGNNKQRYLNEKTAQEYEPDGIAPCGPWRCLLSCPVVPEKDICNAETYSDKSAGHKELRLEKQHTPVSACISKVIIPKGRKVDFTADVNARKRQESEQC